MGKRHRPERLGGEIQKIISELLVRGELKDPGFQNMMIGVSGVDVTGDGSYATVYITALPYAPGAVFSDDERGAVLAAFIKCKGFLRSEINKKVKVRYVPDLIFKFDNSFEYGAKMDELIDSLDIPEAPVEEEKPEDDF